MNRTKATTTNLGLLDTRYLKLDGTNSPMIGDNSTTFFEIQQSDTTTVFNVDTTTPQVTMPNNPVIGGYTLTVPATGTAALLGTANVFTAGQTIEPGCGHPHGLRDKRHRL